MAEENESVIRGKKHGFTVLYNAVLGDRRLNLKTLGLFALMQSFPDDWEYSVSGLAARAGVGRDSIRGCIRQLEETGYLLREQRHAQHGKFGCNIYVLLDCPPTEISPLTEKPSTDDPSAADPLPENRTQVNKHLSKETKSKTPIAPAEVMEALLAYSGKDADLTEAILGFAEKRAKKNNRIDTLRSVHILTNRLDRLSDGRRDRKIAMLNNATEGGWSSVYALKAGELTGDVPERLEECEGVRYI